MAEIANTLWYRLGTISVTDGSTKVTGVGTHWTTAGINPGATLRVDGRPYAYEVKRVVSDTEIELGAPYYGGSASGATYSIDRNFQSTTNAKLAADVTDMVGIYEQVRDGTMPMIEGKSAYQVAVANGYNGTETEWLESLKGNADEIAVINRELESINDTITPMTNGGIQNSAHYLKGRNLGDTFVPGVKAYLGDYWQWTSKISGRTLSARVVDHRHRYTFNPSNVFAECWPYTLYVGGFEAAALNDTDTLEGHLYGSKLFNVTFPIWQQEVEAFFGENRVVTVYENIADAIDSSGVVTHRTKAPAKMFLPGMWNMGFHMASQFDNRDAYQHVSKVKWPYFNSIYPDGNPGFSCNNSATIWAYKTHPGATLYNFKPTSKVFSSASCFVLVN